MKKERKYRRIRWEDRIRIEAWYNDGYTYRRIASRLGRSVSTIYTEVQHGLYDHLDGKTWLTVRRYSAEIAQQYADAQKTIKGVPVKLGHRYDYADYIAREIVAGRSPDDIVGALRRAGLWTVSTPTLYRYIDQGYIPGITNRHLREKTRRKCHKKCVVRSCRPAKGLSIERRPYDVFTRSVFGHWEMDSVIGKSKGKRQSLLVLTERKTRYEIIMRVPSKTSSATVRALDRIFSRFPQGTFRTITVDNGSEFQDCFGMAHDKHGNRRTTIYYCHPYCSSERASNECANRLVRRFFPKGKSMKDVTQKDCDRAAAAMNAMHRRILDYATADELFQAELAALSNQA